MAPKIAPAFQKVISPALITYPAQWGRHDWRQAEHEGPALVSRGRLGRVGRVRALLVLMLPRLWLRRTRWRGKVRRRWLATRQSACGCGF